MLKVFPMFFMAMALISTSARAEIMVSPLRQVLGVERRSATFEVSNPSTRLVEARVRWLDLSATPDGYERAGARVRNQLSAAPFLSVEPASFRLEPGARTTVTVTLRNPARLPTGERRSHLVFEADAARTPLRKVGSGLQVDVGLGISTPVIVRHGSLEAKASIGETRLVRGAGGLLEIETTIERSGSASTYGRLRGEFVKSGEPGAAAAEVIRIENIAVHIDAASRRVRAPLGSEALPAGILTLVYEGEGEYSEREFTRRSFEILAP